ncbi:MAG: RluA family pseudouridine synthase [Candidatus Omnitrophica bacterium]|nr:RluA family pseudouridine synthase [Candidatus Omnitrophota bacterium]MCB9747716.1 RluA family pseudouridine synthase [Candidatus Omnitrophota bacterium]
MNHEAGFLRRPIEILYEDQQFIVFNKPAGLLIIPTPKKEKNTLTNIVNHQYARQDQHYKLHPCHRLDRETSGVIVYAKGKQNQKWMMDEFKKKGVTKNYIALVYGQVKKGKGELKSYINDLDHRKYQGNTKARFSITQYKVIEQKAQYSILDINLITGRTNQIRIQFSSIGHPLVGERKYALARDYQLKFKRVALHAKLLSWEDPRSKKRITVKAPLPEDIKKFIQEN